VGSQSARLLEEKGYQVEFDDEYSGNHFFHQEEFTAIMEKKFSDLLS
jgi:hypothetical protein